jgi:hypothetical protein
MTQYGNYQNRIQQQSPQTESTSSKVDNTQSLLKLKEDDSKTSKISLGILTSPEKNTLSTKLQEKIINEEVANEKINSVRANAISATNGANGHDEFVNLAPQQKKIKANEDINEQEMKDPSILNRIKSMNEDELDEALGKPEFEKYIDEIIQRLENLGEEVKQSNEQIKQSNVQTNESKTEFKDVKEEQIKINLKEQELKNKVDIQITNFEKVFGTKINGIVVDSASVRGFESLNSDSTNLNAQNVRILQKETATLLVSKENVKNYKVGQKVEWKNGDNVEIVKLRRVQAFSKEQESVLNDFLDTVNNDHEAFSHFMGTYFLMNAQLPNPTESKSDKKGDLATSSIQNKYMESDRRVGENINNNGTQVTVDKKNKIELNFLTSPIGKWIERNKKLEKELRIKEQKINEEVMKHERLIEETNRNRLKLEIKNSDIEVSDLKNKNKILDNEFKENGLKEYMRAIKDVDHPEPLRIQFKELAISYHKFDKVVENANQYDPKLISEVVAHKKEVLNVVQSILKNRGSVMNVKKGLNRSH